MVNSSQDSVSQLLSSKTARLFRNDAEWRKLPSYRTLQGDYRVQELSFGSYEALNFMNFVCCVAFNRKQALVPLWETLQTVMVFDFHCCKGNYEKCEEFSFR